MEPWFAIQTIKLLFSSRLIRLISSFLSNRKFKVMVEGELSSPQDKQAEVLQSSVLAPTLYGVYSLYIYYTPQTPGVYLALFADDTYMYNVYIQQGYVLRQLQRGLTSKKSWCGRWNIKINEDKTQAIYFFHRRRPVEAYVTLKGWHVPS